MEYPSDGKCSCCGAALPQMLHETCMCNFCKTEYTRPTTSRASESTGNDAGKAVSLCEQSDLAYAGNRMAEAVNYLEEALKYDRGNYNIWNKLGRAYRQIGNLDRARECYRKALDISPDSIDVIANIGVLEIACNNYQLAYEYCKRAYEAGNAMSPDYALYAANYAFCIAKLGNKKEALKMSKIARKRGYVNYTKLKRMIKQS